MDNQLVYQRAEDARGKNPVVNQYVYYPDGRLEKSVGGGIAYNYSYTDNGLLKSKSASGRLLLEYGYDKNRNLATLTDETGKTIRYTYDKMDRLERVTSAADETMLAAYRYHSWGQRKSLHYGNGVQTEYGYGEDGTLTELVTLTPQGEVVLNYQYAYDGNGNCIKKSGDRYQDTYAYDRMNRLTEASYNGRRETYRYDLAGNRLEKESADGNEFYRYNTKNQLLRLEQGESLTSYHYDHQGNLLEESGERPRRYTYDALNRQIHLENNSYHLENRYDGEQLRYETEENGKVIRFLFDRKELVAEREGETSIRYIRGDDVVSSERAENSYSYHVRDEMNSTLFLLDQEHEIQKSYRYDAFGNVLEESGEFQNRLTYTGQMYDGAAGQYYLRARYYNPRIGRFQQEDVYRGDGLNLYVYCGNNPVMYYDPSGWFAMCPGGKTNPGANVDTYRNMSTDSSITGQEHHLNQDAAFRDLIPHADGLSVELGGNAFKDVGSAHYNAHSSMENFWNNYRKNGDLFGQVPTIGEYNAALYRSLQNAGLSNSGAAYSVLEAYYQQQNFGLTNKDYVPRIPGKTNQKK